MRDTAQQAADRIREERRAAGTLGKVQPSGLIVTQISKAPRSTITEVIVVGCHPDGRHSHDDVLEAALAATGETRSSLFGWRVGPILDTDAGSRRVELHTD